MKRTLKNVASVLAFSIIALATVLAAQSAALEGVWLGAIEVNGMKLRLVLKVVRNADGTLAAKLDSVDQGANDLPVDAVSQDGDKVRFEARKFGLAFEGTMNEKGDEIAGNLKLGPASLPLILRRTTAAPKLGRPQDPVEPYPYGAEEVSYKNAKDNVKLAGTLTFPRDGKRHPAVILITGSGGQDRNETVAGHRPFLVLADYLTRQGIAVLRVDDRGIGGSEMGSPAATSENYAGDVLEGIEYLKTRREIDPKRIGLVGHSEGGMIAPMVAARTKDVAFIVLLAGLGQTGADVIYTQTARLHKTRGVPAEVTAQTIAAQKNIFAILRSESDDKIAERKIREAIADQVGAMSEEQRRAFEPFRATTVSQIPLYVSPWFRYFVAYDPRPALKKVKVPVLALNGENDVQASAKENLALIDAALRAGGNRDVTVKSFPKLNHLFQTSTTGLPDEYGMIEETISPQVLETVAGWILTRTRPASRPPRD